MSGFVTITPPSANEPTSLELFALPVIADLNNLDARISSRGAGGDGNSVTNGGFETTLTDTWDVTALPSGSYVVDNTSGNTGDGGASVKVTQALSGGSNGGAMIAMNADSKIPCNEGNLVYVRWMLKCSSASLSNKLEVLFYDYAGSYVSTTTAWTDSATNPTSWTTKYRAFLVPSTARFYILRFTLGVAGGAAGDSWLDSVQTFSAKDDEVLYQEERAAGNNSTVTVLSDWSNRTLDSVRTADKYGTYTVGTNKITVNFPGKYQIRAFGVAVLSTGSHWVTKLRVFNNTASSTVCSGPAHAGTGQQTLIFNGSVTLAGAAQQTLICEGSVTLTVASDIYVQQIANADGTVIGGYAFNVGEREVYAGLYIRRMGDA